MEQNEPIDYEPDVTYRRMLDRELTPEGYVTALRAEADRVVKAEIERWEVRLEEQRSEQSLKRRLMKFGSSIIRNQKRNT